MTFSRARAHHKCPDHQILAPHTAASMLTSRYLHSTSFVLTCPGYCDYSCRGAPRWLAATIAPSC